MTSRSMLFQSLLATSLLFAAASANSEELRNHASGKGSIFMPPSPEHPDGSIAFEPKYGAASRTRKPDRIWLLLTDRDTSSLKWSKKLDQVNLLREWCKTEKAQFVLFELVPDGTAEAVYECGGTGALSTEMISNINGLTSVATKFEIFDANRIQGAIVGGKGYCGDETYCTTNRDFVVDVSIQH